MSVAAASDNCGKVVAGVIGRIAEVAADDDGCVIKQRAVALFDFIECGEELVQVFHDVNFDSAEFLQHVRFAAVMRKRVPAPRRARDFDGSVNPVERQRDDSGRIRLKREPGEFQQVADLR